MSLLEPIATNWERTFRSHEPNLCESKEKYKQQKSAYLTQQHIPAFSHIVLFYPKRRNISNLHFLVVRFFTKLTEVNFYVVLSEFCAILAQVLIFLQYFASIYFKFLLILLSIRIWQILQVFSLLLPWRTVQTTAIFVLSKSSNSSYTCIIFHKTILCFVFEFCRYNVKGANFYMRLGTLTLPLSLSFSLSNVLPPSGN